MLRTYGHPLFHTHLFVLVYTYTQVKFFPSVFHRLLFVGGFIIQKYVICLLLSISWFFLHSPIPCGMYYDVCSPSK